MIAIADCEECACCGYLVRAEELFDAFHEAFHAEGLVNIAIHAEAFGPDLMAFACVSCNHDDEGSLAFFLVRAFEFFEYQETASLGECRHVG